MLAQGYVHGTPEQLSAAAFDVWRSPQHSSYPSPKHFSPSALHQTANAAGIRDLDPSAAGSRRSTLGTHPVRLPAHSVDKSSSIHESRVTSTP